MSIELKLYLHNTTKNMVSLDTCHKQSKYSDLGKQIHTACLRHLSDTLSHCEGIPCTMVAKLNCIPHRHKWHLKANSSITHIAFWGSKIFINVTISYVGEKCWHPTRGWRLSHTEGEGEGEINYVPPPYYPPCSQFPLFPMPTPTLSKFGVCVCVFITSLQTAACT